MLVSSDLWLSLWDVTLRLRITRRKIAEIHLSDRRWVALSPDSLSRKNATHNYTEMTLTSS